MASKKRRSEDSVRSPGERGEPEPSAATAGDGTSGPAFVDPKRAVRMHLDRTGAAGARPARAELSFDSFRLDGRNR